MNERMQRILADLKARQDAGEHMACPRCGCDTMKPAVYTNALSRQADIMVCDDCGMSEAKLAFMGNPMPLTQWACFKPRRPDGDFKAVTGEEAWREIQETQLDWVPMRKWYTTGSLAVKCSARMASMYSSTSMKPLLMVTLPSRATMYPAPSGLFRNILRIVGTLGWRTRLGETQMMHMVGTS